MTYQVPGSRPDQFCDIQFGAGEVLLKFGEGFVHHLTPQQCEILGKSILFSAAMLRHEQAAEPVHPTPPDPTPPEPTPEFKRSAFKIIEGGNT